MSRYAQYPPEWDNEPTWVTCPTCLGDGCIRDTNDLDVTCPMCLGDGGYEP
jgi:DnaJ-class molecular chaperone